MKATINAKLGQKTSLGYNKLGDSDLVISEITIGTMTFGEQNTEKEAHEILSYAFENGINALDTAESVSACRLLDFFWPQFEFVSFWFWFKFESLLFVAVPNSNKEGNSGKH